MTEPTPQAFPLPGPDAARTRAPQAFVLAGDGETKAGPGVEIHEQPEPTEDPAPPKPVEPAGRWFSLGTLFWTGVSLLVTLYLADAGWSFVQSLAAKEPRLGQIALGCWRWWSGWACFSSCGKCSEFSASGLSPACGSRLRPPKRCRR